MFPPIPTYGLIQFGTDEDKAIYIGFAEGLGSNRKGKHVTCFNHVRDSVKRKMTNLNMPKDAQREILHDIFGFIDGETKHAGIVDSKSEYEFEARVLNVQE